MEMDSLIRFKSSRDYSLVGPESDKAVAAGLASGDWYKSPVPRARMKQLMQRRDGPAIRDTLIWLSLLVLTGAGVAWFYGSWLAWPFAIAYGVLYASTADSRWHECGHRTAFKTAWMNDWVYALASFMMLRSPTAWRWSHARHHTDTIIVGRDPEIAGMRPPQLIVLGLNVFGIVAVPQSLGILWRYAAGRLNADEHSYIPPQERGRVFAEGRIILGVLAVAALAAIALQSWVPVLLIGLPNFYGAWLLAPMGLAQHLGLAEDVLDHRLDSRTMYLNPVLRFIYWNMNYHVEHHMYPAVPYHALPALHEEIRGDCPAPCPSLSAAWAEILPAVFRQLRDPTYFIGKELPPGAGRLQRPAESPGNRA